MPPRFPSATYRLQLSRRFGLDAARRLVPYLRRLGIDTVYLSPLSAATTGSAHGYDAIDPGRIDPARGGARALARLDRTLQRNGMGLVLDVVPNHVAASPENPAWVDVLARGPRSRYAGVFDIAWDRSPDGRPAVVLPWLAETPESAFSAGRLAWVWRSGELRLRWGGTELPGAPRAVRRLLDWGRAGPSRRPPGDGAVRRMLDRLNRGADRSDRVRRARLLADLHYRLVPWWQAAKGNYRRFFDITGLVGVRSDTPAGFDYVHRWLLRSPPASLVGLRIDHVDGVADPWAYLRRLRRAVRRAGGRRLPFVVVEKVLAGDESLPASWPVDGTTGYEALNWITGVLLPPTAPVRLDAAFRRCCPGAPASFADEAYSAKVDVERTLFVGERTAIVAALLEADERSRADPAVTTGAVEAVTAALSVYRTYLRPGHPARPEDRRRLREAWAEAARRRPELAHRAPFRSLRRRWPAAAGPRRSADVERAAAQWQQWTGAVAAKGVEDTAFYRFPRFLAANEVGGDPDRFALTPEGFHARVLGRARRWPHALTTTSTHDSKWGEDARARLLALADWPDEWARTVVRWQRRLRRILGWPPRPSRTTPAEEYRIFQTVLATAPTAPSAWRSYWRRLEPHLQKAAREAKLATSWDRPNGRHESAVRAFAWALLFDPRARPTQDELARWLERAAATGAQYSMRQVVLRLTMPGVPDLYQGSEGWNRALVDPDNRRAVRFDRLARLLDAGDAPAVADRWPVAPRRRGRRGPAEVDKVALTARLLRFRRTHRRLFSDGRYVPLRETRDGREGPVLAFARQWHRDRLVVLIGRGLPSVPRRGGRPPTGPGWGLREVPLPPGWPSVWRRVAGGAPLRAVGPPSDRSIRLTEAFDPDPWTVLYARGARRPRAKVSPTGEQ
jgi:(1->4)-alpha-D-glucan 1-alpha-D-glucosylmutase